MGLFNFFNNRTNGHTLEIPIEDIQTEVTDIPEDLFTEQAEPSQMQDQESPTDAIGLDTIYSFLQENYEYRGYNDALATPDRSYKDDNIMLLKQDLNILIEQVKTSCEDKVRTIDYHISTRESAGLLDLVEELKSKKETILEHMHKLSQIHSDAEEDKGMCQRMILSYSRGFSKGLAALTAASIL